MLTPRESALHPIRFDTVHTRCYHACAAQSMNAHAKDSGKIARSAARASKPFAMSLWRRAAYDATRTRALGHRRRRRYYYLQTEYITQARCTVQQQLSYHGKKIEPRCCEAVAKSVRAPCRCYRFPFMPETKRHDMPDTDKQERQCCRCVDGDKRSQRDPPRRDLPAIRQPTLLRYARDHSCYARLRPPSARRR